MTLDKSTWTYVDLARRQAQIYGEREFIHFEDGTRLTFAGVDRESNQLARNLAELGVVSGDRIFVVVKNRAEFVLIMLATMKLGAIFVPINTELKGAFLQHQLRNAEPSIIFVDADLSDSAVNMIARPPRSVDGDHRGNALGDADTNFSERLAAAFVLVLLASRAPHGCYITSD